MKIIKPVVAIADNEARDRESLSGRTAPLDPTELRALSDYELWFVGGGDDVPEW